jgi:hypothetical protein
MNYDHASDFYAAEGADLAPLMVVPYIYLCRKFLETEAVPWNL